MDYCQRHTNDLDQVRRRYEGRNNMTEPEKMDASVFLDGIIRQHGYTPARCKGCDNPFPKERLRQYDLCPTCDDELADAVDEMIECQIEAAKLEAKEREEK